MARKFTRKQIEALTAANISFEIDGAEIIVAVPYEGHSLEGATAADIDGEATEAQVRKVCEMFPEVGGFCTGWGGWHLRKGYSNPAAGFDYCDTASPAHW